MNSICRLCIKENCELQDLTIESDGNLVNKIFECLSYQLNLEKGLPTTICTICYNKIEDIAAFRQKIIENEKILLNRLTEFNTNDDNLSDSQNCPKEDDKNDIIEVYVDINNKAVCNIKNETKIDKKTDTTNSKTFNLSPNQCLMCFELFASKKNLQKHYLTKELESQVIKKEETSTFLCKECNKEFKNKYKLLLHISVIHSDKPPFSCKICGKMFKNVINIMTHSKSHIKKKFACCFNCGYTSGYLNNVKNHEKTHTSEYKYTCNECGKGFQAKTWYEQHQNLHKGIKQFVCNICGAAFHMDRYLTSHKISVHPESFTNKKYKCVYCSLIYGSKHNLNLHLESHGIKREFLCETCGKNMRSAQQLAAHKVQHVSDRTYVCGKCNKSFARKYNLELHEHTHSDPAERKRFRCDMCPRAFSQQCTLYRHQRNKHS